MHEVVPQRYQQLREMLKSIPIADIVSGLPEEQRTGYHFTQDDIKWSAFLVYKTRTSFLPSLPDEYQNFALHFHKEREEVMFTNSIVLPRAIANLEVIKLTDALTKKLHRLLDSNFITRSRDPKQWKHGVGKFQYVDCSMEYAGKLEPQDDSKVIELFNTLKLYNKAIVALD